MSPTLFPAPHSIPLTTSSPIVLPGVSVESTVATQLVLSDNHVKWHAFFNDKGFHNHISHHIIALWALGAPKETIDAAYANDCKYQIKAYTSPNEITVENFNEHLGDKRFYSAYLAFFTAVVQEKGGVAAIEDYIFATKANIDVDGTEKPHPQMLVRFMSSIFHPMIHTGNGVEFNVPGLIVEGLAQTAVHKARSEEPLIPPSLFGSTVTSIAQLAAQVGTVLNIGASSKQAIHAFTILAHLSKDSSIVGPGVDSQILNVYASVVSQNGSVLSQMANQWGVTTGNVSQKVEELHWLVVTLYAVAGHTHKKDTDFNADFFFMHLVTSSTFAGTFVSQLCPSSQVLYLRAFFAGILTWYVARGKPTLDIPAFFSADTKHPIPAGPKAPVPDWSLPSASSPLASTPNPWFPVVQRTISHPDDHLAKIVRTLLHFGRIYGTRPPGLPDFAETSLAGADRLDGSLFIRAAALTVDRLTRTVEGSEPAYWDRQGYF